MDVINAKEFGSVGFEVERGVVSKVGMSAQLNRDSKLTKQDQTVARETRRQLDEYFRGKRKAFELPLGFKGTEFQRRVWLALCSIPWGETRTYADVARMVGCPKGARAVGQAVNRNPLMIIIPCHRVIGSSGDLTGFAPGVKYKKWLLSHEGIRV